MTNRQPDVDELGVVDPLRMPTTIRDLGARFASWPLVTRVFVSLAVIDVVVFGLVLNERTIESPLGLMSWFARTIGPAVLLLMPAVIAMNSSGADGRARRVLVGASAVGISSLGLHIAQVIDGATRSDFALSPVDVGLAAVRLTLFAVAGAGWFLMARGLAGLARPPINGRRRVAAIVITAIAVVSMLTSAAMSASSAFDSARDLFDTDAMVGLSTDRFLLEGAVGMGARLSALTLPYLIWILLTRVESVGPRRLATRIAAIAAVALALVRSTPLLVYGAYLALGPNASGDLQNVSFWVLVAASYAGLLVDLLLVAAFALGLARPLAAEQAPARPPVPG